MAQYINKDDLVAELERLARLLPKDKGLSMNLDWARNALSCLYFFINTLEVKEVDLEKETDKWYNTKASKEFENVFYGDIEKCAQYFFELGLKTQKAEITPIPLTLEILEKNGFERSEVFVEWKYENDNVYMIYKPFPYLKIQTEECTVAFPCQYVHELQRALRFCKIEKEIIL